MKAEAKIKLQKWMERNTLERKKYSSILFKHKDEIEELYCRGYTQKQILKFLDEMSGIKTTRQNLSGFINRHINKSTENEEQSEMADDLQPQEEISQ